MTERVRAGLPTIGTFVNLGSSLATEVLALAGFDWLLVDLEHGGGGESTLLSQVHAASAHGVPVVVRVESDHRIRAGRVLDLGASGVMLPRIESVDEARSAVANLHYPPAGRRGVATYNRARRFGLDHRTLQNVDTTVLSILQIETAAALDCVEAISETAGADVLFVGPSDLSVSLGIGGQLTSDVFMRALDRVLAATRSTGTCAGILAADVASAKRYLDRGFAFVAISSDAAFLLSSASKAAGALHPLCSLEQRSDMRTIDGVRAQH